MGKNCFAGTFWPSDAQASLLVAALGDRREAVEAWEEVRSELVLDELETGSFELMPLIYRSLTGAGYDDEELPRLKGIYRRAWVKNNLLVERTAEMSETLEGGDVPALFMEGVTIALRFYPELGLRPTSMIDVLVEEHDVPRAVQELARLGWRDASAPAAARPEVRYLFDASGSVCMLRSRLAADFIGRGNRGNPNEPVWSAAERQALGGTEVPVPSRTATLLAVCVAHARAEGARNVQWLADAKMVLGGDVRWNELLAAAGEHRQVIRLREAMRYFARLPGPKPPPAFFDQLSETTVTSRERLSYYLASSDSSRAGTLPRLAAEHVVRTADQSSLRALATFPRHLRERWGLSHTWRVPFAAGQRALRLLLGNPDRPP